MSDRPFDPLAAGWIECEMCPEPMCGCEYCDGLGIVVGPPEDEVYLVGSILHAIKKGDNAYSRLARAMSIKDANAYRPSP